MAGATRPILRDRNSSAISGLSQLSQDTKITRISEDDECDDAFSCGIVNIDAENTSMKTPDNRCDESSSYIEYRHHSGSQDSGYIHAIAQTPADMAPTPCLPLPEHHYNTLLPAPIAGNTQQQDRQCETVDHQCTANRREHSCTRNNSNTIVFCLIFCNTLLTSICIGIVAYFVANNRPPDNPPVTSVTPDLCMSCRYLARMNSISDKTLDNMRDVKDESQCCFHTVMQIIDYVEEVTTKEANAIRRDLDSQLHALSNNPGSTWEIYSRPALHLESTTEPFHVQGREYSIVWDQKHLKRQGSIEVQARGMDIQIKITGYYFLFSRLNFRFGGRASTVEISHYIHRKQGGTSIPIAGVKEKYPVSGETRHSSQLQTIAHLWSGQTITVIIHGKQYLDLVKPQHPEMGIFLVG